jgi:hypothetical protein
MTIKPTSLKDGNEPVSRTRGVRTLEGLKDRCFVDEDTGCWLWRAALSAGQPKVWVPPGVLSDAGAVMPAGRAAWLLSGNKARSDQVVYRTCGCQECVAPEHGIAVTRKAMGKHVAESDRWKNNPARVIANAKNRHGLAKPREIVQQAEQMFSEGVPQKIIRERLGISQRTAVAIKSGIHQHSTNRVKTLRVSSVFNLGGG